MDAGQIVNDARCEECGDIIRTAEVRDSGKVICSHCMNPIVRGVGNGCNGHYDDDPSGASASWDIAVRMNEGGE